MARIQLVKMRHEYSCSEHSRPPLVSPLQAGMKAGGRAQLPTWCLIYPQILRQSGNTAERQVVSPRIRRTPLQPWPAAIPPPPTATAVHRLAHRCQSAGAPPPLSTVSGPACVRRSACGERRLRPAERGNKGGVGLCLSRPLLRRVTEGCKEVGTSCPWEDCQMAFAFQPFIMPRRLLCQSRARGKA